MSNEVKLTYEDYRQTCGKLAARIIDNGCEYNSIYPIPRGGYFAAIELSKHLDLPIIYEKERITENTLIVDDITDTGKTLEGFKENDKAVVYCKERSQQYATFVGEIIDENDWVVFPDEHDMTIEENIVRLLEYIGEDPNREGLKGTPDRIIRMWKEIFRGYDKSQQPKITTFDNGKDGVVYDNMVIDQGDFHSNCEHHMVWFWGKYWFAYIPNPKGKILGISKIGRVVDFCSSRLQIQERLVHDIVTMLTTALGDENPPLGIALVMKGHHSCKEFRGAKKKGIMTSSYLAGAFKDDPLVRAEFMQLVNNANYE